VLQARGFLALLRAARGDSRIAKGGLERAALCVSTHQKGLPRDWRASRIGPRTLRQIPDPSIPPLLPQDIGTGTRRPTPKRGSLQACL